MERVGLTASSPTEQFLNESLENRSKLKLGTPTLIPWNEQLPGFSNIVPGMVRGDLCIVTGISGIGKSRVGRKLALKDIRAYCESKSIKLKVFINSIEESASKLVGTFVAQEAHSTFGMDLTYYEAINFRKSNPSDKDMNSIISCTKAVDKKYFANNLLNIETETNPFNFYKKVRDYLFEVGTFYYIHRDTKGRETARDIITRKAITKGNFTNYIYSGAWNHYKYHEPTLVVTIFDTINKATGYVENLGGVKNTLSQYDSISRYVHHYAAVLLGKIHGCINFVVAQQKGEQNIIETNFTGKTVLEKLKPNLGALASNKSMDQSATLILGLFNPLKYGTKKYEGYEDIHKLKGGYLSMLFMKSREGAIPYPANEVPLITNFAIDDFVQLPPPDMLRQEEIYKKYYKH